MKCPRGFKMWAISCFEFESANGNLINFCHGTRKIDLQVLILNKFHVATACMLVLFQLTITITKTPFSNAL